MAVQIPDDSDFSSFKDQCLSGQGWNQRYHKGGVTVWCRPDDGDGVQKIKMKMACKGVSAQTVYDVLHDSGYRKKWDSNMIDAYDIGRLTVNADVGYYSWRCPVPLKNRDFVTLRSWLPLGDDFLIINYSVKHAQHPPKKDFVRAVSLLTGYFIQSAGAEGSSLYYLSQLDPRGSLPKWVTDRVSQFVAPKAMRKIYKASRKYPEWKRKHCPDLKPWMFPEQNTLPCISVSELSPQRADSLENIDESGLGEGKGQHGGDDDDDDEET
ncbi:START domain-containing protein 10 [Corythoichthys intestinalis]|uniref:START domain-containing protein 10 n=1 Tax=Corythoichthys intestinalis TaxID=161448 RepID=UPI0025A6602A|nr:START domain-containing protein 10 [Corythoichthys intestinalis]XP_061793352.1 START domain-containing protein 10-like [Nerophis lumbriciformis]XP_061813407.1 START domain-containing protein 10-like [Nerophis lumbriciformis]